MDVGQAPGALCPVEREGHAVIVQAGPVCSVEVATAAVTGRPVVGPQQLAGGCPQADALGLPAVLADPQPAARVHGQAGRLVHAERLVRPHPAPARLADDAERLTGGAEHLHRVQRRAIADVEPSRGVKSQLARLLEPVGHDHLRRPGARPEPQHASAADCPQVAVSIEGEATRLRKGQLVHPVALLGVRGGQRVDCDDGGLAQRQVGLAAADCQAHESGQLLRFRETHLDDVAERVGVRVDAVDLEFGLDPAALAADVDGRPVAGQHLGAGEVEPFGTPQLVAVQIERQQRVPILGRTGTDEDLVADRDGGLRGGVIREPAAAAARQPRRVAGVVHGELVTQVERPPRDGLPAVGARRHRVAQIVQAVPALAVGAPWPGAAAQQVADALAGAVVDHQGYLAVRLARLRLG